MAASNTDKITDVRNAARPNSARATGTRSAGGTSLACDNLSGWPTASKVHFVTYQIDSSSVPVAGTQLDCTGIVSGNTIGSFTVKDGTDVGNSVNDVIEMLPTAAWGQDLADALTVQHTRAGAHTGITTDTITVTSGSTLPAGDIGAADLATGAVTFTKLGAGATRLGLGTDTGATLTTSFVTHATVTATSTGGVCEVSWGAQVNNAGSGADRTFTVQVLCDGVNVAPNTLTFSVPLIGGNSNALYYGFIHVSTPAAGAHTWNLQFEASANTAVGLGNNFLEVREVV